MSAAVGKRASPRGQAELVLGKAVHPDALDRLFELWPEAVVSVRHDDSRNDGVDLRVTTVEVWDKPVAAPGAFPIRASARCRLDTDNYDRRFGIDLAFRRALKKAKQADPSEGRG